MALLKDCSYVLIRTHMGGQSFYKLMGEQSFYKPSPLAIQLSKFNLSQTSIMLPINNSDLPRTGQRERERELNTSKPKTKQRVMFTKSDCLWLKFE